MVQTIQTPDGKQYIVQRTLANGDVEALDPVTGAVTVIPAQPVPNPVATTAQNLATASAPNPAATTATAVATPPINRRKRTFWAVFLITAPIALLVLSIAIYAIINWATANSTNTANTTAVPELCDNNVDVKSGLAGALDSAKSCAPDPDSAQLFGETSSSVTAANIALFLTGSVAVFAMVPCVVIGIVMLVNLKKKNA